MKQIHLILFLLCAFTLNSQANTAKRERMELQGNWQFELDPTENGLKEGFVTKRFSDAISLPGTTDTNQKGKANLKQDETTHLSRAFNYVGKAWYRKQVTIPKEWDKKSISLTLERTKPTVVWIDGKEVGKNDNISTAQVYDVTSFLSPGKHEITVMVDNGQSVPKQLHSSSHAYTESTQTNWNGIIGEIFLEAKNRVNIKSVQLYPDAQNKWVTVKVEIENAQLLPRSSALTVNAHAWNSPKKHKVAPVSITMKKGESLYTIQYKLGENALLWSEFDPTLYTLTTEIKGIDSQNTHFGLRDFATQGTQFSINGQPTFLRGKHDACVWPLTGHVAMDVASWRRYFQICKEYGINHCRFHSWCPPKACFEAADIEGIYLQTELPFWGGLRRSETYLCDFLFKEGVNIQNEYGNHASFVMFTLGNELSGDLDVMQEFTSKFRAIDSRHLYAFGANNFLGNKGVVDGEDFLVTCRVGAAKDYSTHTRGSFSFADAPEGGFINNTYPNSTMCFSNVVAKAPLPIISHETGQFQVYPNYDEIKKYTGALKPHNFEIFQDRLAKAGMKDQAEDFFKASGRWSALLYKADIEMDLRTTGFGGFQLLDLQDYPGQGSAYVGILDAFMDSKGLISAQEWRGFCNDIVPLFVTETFCYINNQQLSGTVKIANYSNQSQKGKKLNWILKSKLGSKVLNKGAFPITTNDKGLLEVGAINISLAPLTQAQELSLELWVEGADEKNFYPLWVYPKTREYVPATVFITKTLDEEMLSRLRNGEKVLWFPNRKTFAEKTVGGLFQTDYWNYRMFKGICERIKKPVSPGTLGILTNPKHPIFADFPTDYHTNHQWYPIVKASYPFILDKLNAEYRPIVQVIDNVERNHKLGLIFELNVEGGKLLICMSDLDAVNDKPEARQLYQSMLNYMTTDKFAPTQAITVQSLVDLFTKGNDTKEIKGVTNISYE